MDISQYTGLVLEGGGMRGVFTCGVLDYFMDNNIHFPYAIGVSAGACNGLSYMSGQRGRAKFSNIDLLAKYHYIGLKNFIRNGNIMDFDLLFNRFPEEIIPYNYNSYFSNKARFEMVTTNCITGEPNYFEEKQSSERVIEIVKASSSLPFMCPIAYVDNEPMLDGGICDSIPVERAISQGFDKNIVVLTRNKGYRKQEKNFKIPSLFYRKYPQVRKALENRNKLYNYQLELVDQLETKGQVVVIRPQQPVEVGRVEKDTTKLLELYNQGYECAKQVFTISK